MGGADFQGRTLVCVCHFVADHVTDDVQCAARRADMATAPARQSRLQHVLRTGVAAAPTLRGDRGVVTGARVGVGLVDLPDELRRKVASLFADKNLCDSLAFYARTSTQGRDDVQALLDDPGSVALIQRFWENMALRAGLGNESFPAVRTNPTLDDRFNVMQLEGATQLPNGEILDFEVDDFEKLAQEQAIVELPLPEWLATPPPGDDARALLKKACKDVAVRRYMVVVGSLLAANDALMESHCKVEFPGSWKLDAKVTECEPPTRTARALARPTPCGAREQGAASCPSAADRRRKLALQRDRPGGPDF